MSDNQADNWAETELLDTDLGDERRTKRLIKIAMALAEQPTASLPQAMGGEAALKGAYRFFENPANGNAEILSGHIRATYERMKKSAVVLAVQDTTYLEWKPASKKASEIPYQVGCIMHGTLAITPERVVLGVLQAQIWERDPETYAQMKPHKERPIEEKESNKWLRSLESVIEAHKHMEGVRLVSVGDREADVYELFVRPRPQGVDLLVRAAQDRRLVDDEQRTLWKTMASQPIAATFDFEVARNQQRPARTAHMQVRWKAVTLRPPDRPKGNELAEVKVWAVWAYEPHPPDGVESVEWMLLTSLPVTNTEEALEKIEWYACRWGIEVWHKVIKSGCKIESRQLEDVESFKRLLVIFCVVSWRILYTTMLSRAIPNSPCTVLFEPDEWQAAYCILHDTRILPETEPTLREAVHMVARLGGYLERTGAGEPGVQTLWKGFIRLYDLARMYRLLRPPKEMQ